MIAWYGHPGLAAWGWTWIVWMVLFWGGLLAAAIYLIRHRRPASAATDPAETVLAERYARGEIDADEYRRRQAVLREHRDQGQAP